MHVVTGRTFKLNTDNAWGEDRGSGSISAATLKVLKIKKVSWLEKICIATIEDFVFGEKKPLLMESINEVSPLEEKSIVVKIIEVYVIEERQLNIEWDKT